MPPGGRVAAGKWAPPEGVHCPRIAFGAPDPARDGDRWFQIAALAGELAPVLDGLLAEVAANRGYDDGHSLGGGLSLLTSGAALELVLRSFEGYPLPVLHPETTWIEVSAYGNALGLRTESVEVVEPSIEALRAQLRRLLGPLYEAIHARTRFSVVAQWAQLESNLAFAMLRTPCQPQAPAIEFLDRLFSDGDVFDRARPRIDWADRDGERRAFATRRVCCFNYRGKSGAHCSSLCPIVPRAERIERAFDE